MVVRDDVQSGYPAKRIKAQTYYVGRKFLQATVKSVTVLSLLTGIDLLAPRRVGRLVDELVFELVDEEDIVDGDGDFVSHAFEKFGTESIMEMKGFGTAKRDDTH